MSRSVEESLQLYLADVAAVHKRLTREEQTRLAETYARTNDLTARDTLVNSALPLVVFIANKYKRRTGIPLLDLIQQGNEGLIKAAEKYDGSTAFSTYTVGWIKQSIGRMTAEREREIHIPSHLAEIVNKLKRDNVFGKTEGEVDINALAKEYGVKPNYVRYALGTFFSITSTTTADGVFPLESKVRVGINELERDDLDFALSTLHELDRRIFELRYGLGTGRPMTLDEVAGQIGFTRERVRQIIDENLQDLKKAIETPINERKPKRKPRKRKPWKK